MSDKKPDSIRYHYIKSPHYMEWPLNGVYGGVSSRGQFFMSVFTERPAIPRELVFEITDDLRIGDEIESERVSREGNIRIVHGTFHFDTVMARALRDWLDDKLKAIKDPHSDDK